jgi:hypothetical protein
MTCQAASVVVEAEPISVSVECVTPNIEVVVEVASSFAPSAHAATHGAAGSDPVTVATSQITGFTAAAAAAAPVQSVAGRTGTVTLAKADIGLGSADNTADTAKPVSTAQAAADAAVQAAAVQRANHTGTQLAATISDFSAAVQAAAPPTTNASLLTTGTVADARLSANVVLTADSRLSDSRTPTAHKATHATGGADALTASDIGAAAASHTHAASDIASGTIATARLGSGTASSSTFLRGDGSWAAAGSTNANDITTGTLAFARLPARVRAAVNVLNWSSFR